VIGLRKWLVQTCRECYHSTGHVCYCVKHAIITRLALKSICKALQVVRSSTNQNKQAVFAQTRCGDSDPDCWRRNTCVCCLVNSLRDRGQGACVTHAFKTTRLKLWTLVTTDQL
jgi:hypothetical protein